MEVDITYIAIDSQGKEGVLRGEYKWGNEKGRLISAPHEGWQELEDPCY